MELILEKLKLVNGGLYSDDDPPFESGLRGQVSVGGVIYFFEEFINVYNIATNQLVRTGILKGVEYKETNGSMYLIVDSATYSIDKYYFSK